jgi:hypothetical protein
MKKQKQKGNSVEKKKEAAKEKWRERV